MAVDEEFERLKKKRLTVLNAEAPVSTEFELTGEGLVPPSGPIDVDAVRAAIVEALQTVYDPEIPLNIYDLGLIYGFDLDDSGDVDLRMTLTAPGCPVAGSLVGEVHDKVRSVTGVRCARTSLVWDPPWSRERMSEAARLELGLL
jgi:FeS assembly SUF system protein